MKTSLIITSVSPPNKILKAFADGCTKKQWDFIVIGDVATPADFALKGCNYFDINKQREMPFTLAGKLPLKHYSRKNLGYLQAIKNKSEIIIETDDDNMPMPSFWSNRKLKTNYRLSEQKQWINIYTYFTHKGIWPRGFPLDEINNSITMPINTKETVGDCPIQQGLCDIDPDLDAIGRLTMNKEIRFNKKAKSVALAQSAWCPFNSQNTTWFAPAFPLLYLPSHCSFRMTDIWRSYVALRIGAENGWPVLFHKPNVIQERNPHDLIKDFSDEISGYLNTKIIRTALDKLTLKGGEKNITDDLLKCYQTFIQLRLIDKKEIPLLNAWVKDLMKVEGRN
jgi:hypothetical protein